MSREADLLEAIYARPLDDGPREVYADWLLERGDPRGEYIILALAAAKRELAPDDRARLRDLEDAHLQTWFPTVSRKSGAAFRRGFLAELHVDRDDPIAGDQELATLEVVAHVLPGMHARGLRRIQHATLDDFVALAALAEPPPLVEITIPYALDEPSQDISAVYARIELPQLRRVRARVDDPTRTLPMLAWLLRGRAIEEVYFGARDVPILVLVDAVAATTVRLIANTTRFEKFAAARDSTNRFGAIEIALMPADFRNYFDRIATELEAFPDGSLSSVRIANVSEFNAFRWTKKARKRIAALLARHPGVAASLAGHDA